MGSEFKCLEAIWFLFSFSCLPDIAYFSNNILLLSTIWLRRLIGRGYPGLFSVVSVYLNFQSVLLDTLHFSNAKRVSTQKLWVRVSMWFTLFCRAGQSPTSVCSCDAPEAAFRRTEKAALDPGSGASLLSFPLSQEIFQPRVLPLACSFPTRSAGEPHNSSMPSLQKTMSLSTISGGRGWSSPFPGLWKDFLRFTCHLECRLVHRAQSLRLKCDSSSKEWLWVYGREGFCHRLPAWP